MKMNEIGLVDVVKKAKPGQLIYFDDVAVAEMDGALQGISQKHTLEREISKVPTDDGTVTSEPWTPFDSSEPPIPLGDHVTVHFEPWWIRVEFDHIAIDAMVEAGAAVAVMLKGLGVPLWIALVIASILGILKACDTANGGKGVNFYMTPLGVHWYLPR